jgi:hypothetical protein
MKGLISWHGCTREGSSGSRCQVSGGKDNCNLYLKPDTLYQKINTLLRHRHSRRDHHLCLFVFSD